MDRPKKETRLTPEEQREKERLVRAGNPVVRKGSVKVTEEFWKTSRTREGRRALIKQIASSGKPEDIRPGRPISKQFWKLPKPEDPEGLLLKALLEDRREGR